MNAIIKYSFELDIVVMPSGKCYFSSWVHKLSSQVFIGVKTAINFVERGGELVWQE